MSGDSLVLRDIHQAQPAPFWPPAPGWWLLLAVIVLLIAGMMLWRRHRLTRKRRVAALFDDAMQAAGSPVARIAAMSDLLRRASRRIDAKADTLEGDDWLAFLDRGLPITYTRFTLDDTVRFDWFDWEEDEKPEKDNEAERGNR